MNQDYPSRVKNMLDRLQLIKSDLSDVKMSISLDGTIRTLPETTALKDSLTAEDLKRLSLALHDAFGRKDLTRVTALYSYGVLFSEEQRAEIRQETIQEFKELVNSMKNETEVSEMFLHAGFSNMINQLNDSDLTNTQFKLFERYYLDPESGPTGRRVAGIQKNLPISSEQKAVLNKYIQELRAETDKVERKDNTRTIIVVVLTIVLLIIRFALRMSR